MRWFVSQCKAAVRLAPAVQPPACRVPESQLRYTVRQYWAVLPRTLWLSQSANPLKPLREHSRTGPRLECLPAVAKWTQMPTAACSGFVDSTTLAVQMPAAV